ncbi:MAG: glycosyltransferase family 4 protein [candidate division KSB1 bacterium]|nr:glycosyltransferase family 4 protein [candidate division KSB1 bacterium]
MNILMVLQSDYPPDVRLTKEIKSLYQNGYTVYLLCNNLNKSPKVEKIDNAVVIRINKLFFIPQKMRILFNIPLFFNPVWLFSIISYSIKCNINYIHVHDLPLAFSAILAGKLLNKPVVYDMHENYPAAMDIWYKKNPYYFLFKNPFFAKQLDSICMRHAEKLITTIDERKKYLETLFKSDKIHIVSNTIDLERFWSFSIDRDIVDTYSKKYTILYIGFFSSERGLDTVLEGMPILIDRIPEIKLLLVGKGKYTPHLKSLVKKISQQHIDIIDWVPFEQVPSFIQSASVCVDPRPSNKANDSTISHKIFQYMAMEKPIVTSDSIPFSRIIAECRCGEIFKSNSPADFADAVTKIYNSTTPFGKNGKKAVIEKYNWQETTKELLKVYSTLKKGS